MTIVEAEAEAARILAANPMGGPEWDRACDVLLCAMYETRLRRIKEKAAESGKDPTALQVLSAR